MTKFFNRKAAMAEADKLVRVIQQHDPAFVATPLSFKVGLFNAEIDALNARVAAAVAGGKVIHRLSIPKATPSRGESANHAPAQSAKWAHVGDQSLRALLEKAQPSGPSATPQTKSAPKVEVTGDIETLMQMLATGDHAGAHKFKADHANSLAKMRAEKVSSIGEKMKTARGKELAELKSQYKQLLKF